jgi:hypothetical protein
MGAAVVFDAPRADVEPGSDVRIGVRVRNTGQVVDQFQLDVLGDAGWITVSPASINLLPGEEAAATIVCAPPRAPKVPAGEVTFALRVLSHEDTAGSVIEEATVTVGRYTEISAELVPRTSRGCRTGRHELAVDNLGNHPTVVEILPTDPDALLDFRVERAVITTDPGTATFVRIQARPRKRFLRGQNKTVPFQVSVVPEGNPPVVTTGTMLQEAVLPKWLLVAGVAAIAGIVALGILWFTLVRPEVRSTAREAARQENQQLAASVSAVAAKADEAAAGAEEAKAAAGVGSGSGSSDGSSSDGSSSDGGGPGSTEQPRNPAEAAFAPSATDLRVTTEAAPGTPGEFATFTNEPEEGKLYWISDLVLQNPRGDSGILQVRRGDDVLFEVGLDNFRDLDYHFIQPVRFSHDAPIVVAVDCRNPGTTTCTPSVYFTGQELTEPTSPAPTPTT